MTDGTYGWNSIFCKFRSDELAQIVASLTKTVPNPGEPQLRAWRESIPKLQTEVGQVVDSRTDSGAYTAVLEYQLPMEYRRLDAVLLLHDAIVVIELKGKTNAGIADLDQAQAYARDLRAYHAECEGRMVHAVLVPTASKGVEEKRGDVHVCSPELLDQLIQRLDTRETPAAVDPLKFLSEEAYRPLPTLVRAARELFQTGQLRRVKRAAAATEAASVALLEVVRDAANRGRRKLILLSGVPGAGKTLVGLQLVHSHELDSLAVARSGRIPTAPAVFLSGNGPLVEVLSYELKAAGGGGHTFVRGVKKYVERYERNRGLEPPEHVIVYDEAQRAYDAAMVAETHGQLVKDARSEPEHFIEFAERVPEWCVVVALVGTGQEIHKGEEGGISQWAKAIKSSAHSAHWDVHGPTAFADDFAGLTYARHAELSLDKSLRSHLAFEVHRYVAELLSSKAPQLASQTFSEMPMLVAEARPAYQERELSSLARQIESQGHHLRITRDLDVAKRYLRNRYQDDAHARFGIIASSRDRDLVSFGVNNDYQSTKRIRNGPWYGDAEDSPGGKSCRHLRECVTEFGAQGLELDAVLLAWGTDFVMKGGVWNISRARGYKGGGTAVRDAAQLRMNAYRVLLTRARDVTVVFVPPLPELEETYHYLEASGFSTLSD